MRFLIECTYVYEHPQDNSGIQRVVRNIIRELGASKPAVECVPVMMNGGQLYQVLSLAPIEVDHRASRRQALIVKLDHWRNRYWWWHSRLERLWPFSASKTARRLLYWPCKLASLAISLPLRGLLWLNRNALPAPQRAVPLQVQAGDQLVLLDSSWHDDIFPLAEKLKRQGVGIVSVIYDLIPLTHPQFCDAGLVKVFDRWFDWIAATADGFMAISQTISEQVDSEIQRRLGEAEAAKRWHGYFHLGSELDLLRNEARVHPDLQRMFRDPAPVYLMVSTIEPRKNHALLMQAWETLRYSTHPHLKLVVVGNVGWDQAPVLQSFRPWAAAGELFWLNNVPAAELRALYTHAQATVCPGLAEGFDYSGVEAMKCGCPVAASDIPVHREIYDQAAVYFNTYSAADASHCIGQLLSPQAQAQREQLRKQGLQVGQRYTESAILPQWAALFDRLSSSKH